MKVRLACVDDLNEIMELYHLVSDMMEDSAYDIGWRKEVYPTKEIVLLDIEQQTLYVLEKNEKNSQFNFKDKRQSNEQNKRFA